MTLPEGQPVQVAVLMYPGVSELDVGLMLGLLRSLDVPERVGTPDAAAVTLARTRGSLSCAGGLVSTPQFMFAAAPPLAGVLIPGGLGAQKAGRDAVIREFLSQQAAKRVPLALCGSGVLLAGEAGLLRTREVGCAPELSETVWGYLPDDLRPGEVVADEREDAAALYSGPGGLAGLPVMLRLAERLWPAEAVARAASLIGVPQDAPR
ncbi:transcriptional regulator [Deinococcus sp. KNUC1210]|uniref:transcriptional regulator n=1 Tax=Deinococcus sp. KNUC1210 TaxID=2917691 RepID=UPI001EF15055|nr:transcriptional regulator [Deinococcus sp. KNUC1210]ULH15409.1 transcriptional regulator [Deinococcus sp. KNUC1210]